MNGNGERRERLFGTDGIRGVANIKPMTAEPALRVGRAPAFVFRHRPGPPKRFAHGKTFPDPRGRRSQRFDFWTHNQGPDFAPHFVRNLEPVPEDYLHPVFLEGVMGG